MSGTVEIVGGRTVRRDDHWVRAGPLNKTALWHLTKGAMLLLGVTSVVGLLFMWFIDDGPIGGADRAAAEWIEEHRSPAIETLTLYGSMLADPFVKVALVVVVSGAAVLTWRRWHDGVLIAVSVLVEATVFLLASLIVDRNRPPVEQLDPSPPSGSFPSGHAAATVAFYGAVLIVARWHTSNRVVRVVLATVAVVVPLIVGFSRTARGMHHPIDVVAGLILGVAALFVVRRAVARGVDELNGTIGSAVPERLRRLDLTKSGAGW